MPIKLKRKNECMLCTKIVTETVEEHLADLGSIPDQSNCDFSEYMNYRISNGTLLLPLRRGEGLTSSTTKLQLPVVCSTCVTGRKVRTLVNFIQENVGD